MSRICPIPRADDNSLLLADAVLWEAARTTPRDDLIDQMIAERFVFRAGANWPAISASMMADRHTFDWFTRHRHIKASHRVRIYPTVAVLENNNAPA